MKKENTQTGPWFPPCPHHHPHEVAEVVSGWSLLATGDPMKYQGPQKVSIHVIPGVIQAKSGRDIGMSGTEG